MCGATEEDLQTVDRPMVLSMSFVDELRVKFQIFSEKFYVLTNGRVPKDRRLSNRLISHSKSLFPFFPFCLEYVSL